MSKTYKAALSQAMEEAMNTNPNSLIIGQGVTDFKGIFDTIKGFVDKYPNRIIETPLAEDSVAGICIGAALNGGYPINTHIRADFGLLIFNQLINLAAKYKYMFGGLFEIPSMYRMVIGRSWGQGAQHSQSLHSWFAHIPGLRVVMPTTVKDARDLLIASVLCPDPVLFIEDRWLYDEEDELDPVGEPLVLNDQESNILIEGSDLTIVANSFSCLQAKRVIEQLERENYSIEFLISSSWKYKCLKQFSLRTYFVFLLSYLQIF